MPTEDLITSSAHGLFCKAGGFHVDPWAPVDRAVITHAHSDHARPGSRHYLCAADGAAILRDRLGDGHSIQPVKYGEPVTMGGVQVSLHPAGHVLGSAQVRVEHGGERWVISGDYKTQADCTCAGFELVPCDVFVTESTFGLPVYRWKPAALVAAEINQWWQENQAAGRSSLVFAYALGKAQRVLSLLDQSIGPILLHGAVVRPTELYQAAGARLPRAEHATDDRIREARGQGLTIAPPSAQGSPWLRRFGEQSSAIASGWMQVRGNRRRGNVDRGFILSDHADWDGLMETIAATGATTIGVTHGYIDAVTRWLGERGWDTRAYATRFSSAGEDAESSEAVNESE